MDLVRKLLMSPMSRKKNANNSNKRLSMPVCSSQATNIPLKSRNRDMSHNQSSVSISLHQSSTSLLSSSSGDLKYFGEPLQDILARERGKVPRLVVAASQFICDKGLQQEGLFRVSGNARAIENLKMAIGKTGDVVIGNHNEVGTVASLLKLFFRQLPDPLIPQDMTESFLRLISNDSYSTERCFRELRRLCEKLPPCNYTTLKYLVQLLVLVARHENSNKMSPQALGIVFGPNIFRTNMKNQGLTNYIVTCFITGYDRIFRTSEEVFSTDAGEISHPNIMRPAPSRPRRYSHEEGLPPMQLNQEIKADDSSGKDDGDDDDDDDEVKGVMAPPTHRSAPPPTPRSLAGTTDTFSFDNCDTSPKASVINVDQLLGSEVQNDESQHSLRCLEEEISEVISSVLFPTDTIGDRLGSADGGVSHDGNRKENTGTLKKRKVKKTEQVMPHGIDSLPSNSLLKNYRRPQGPKNRRLPSTQLLKSSAGNTTPGTPRRCPPKANQEKTNLSGDRNQIRKSPEISANPLITTTSLSGHKKAKSMKSINQMSVKGVKVKEAPVKVGQLDRQQSTNKKWTTALSWNSGNEVTNGMMADRDRNGGNNGDEFLKRNLKLVHKVDSIFQEKAEFIPKRKVLTPGIRHSVQCQRSSLRNNNNTESFNVDANNSCTCGIDDDDGDGDDERGKEEAMQNVADREEEQKDHESEVENVSVSHETVENFKLPSIGNKPSAFGSTSFCPKQRVEASEDESPKELPQENPVDPATPIKSPIPEDGDLPTTGDDANDSAAECLSLVMNLSQPSLGDAENADNNVDDFKMHKMEEHVRRGSKHFSCDRKSDSADDEDEDGVKPDPFKGHISSMEVQDVNSKRQSLTSLDKLTNYSSNESQASVEEQIQECVADLQRFRDSLRILEEKYIARYNQKPSKIARMIDKDMSYYESQIKRCRLMLRKLRKLKQQLPHPLPELLSSSQVKPSQSTQRSVKPDEEVDDDVGVERDTSDRYVSTDCDDLQKKKEKIEMLRSQLFHQQQFSPHSSPKTHRARKMSVSSPGVGGVDRPGNQSRREGTKSLSPSRHLLHDSTQQPHHHHHRHCHQRQLDEGDLSRFQLIQLTDHHHDQQKQQQQQLTMDSPPQHKRQILLQPISQELPDELKEMKTSMENLEKELEQMRIADNRNFSINLMTREELKKEKTDMQKALLKFESTFGRPTSRIEKSLVKSIYARYSEVKKELRRFDESSRVSPVEVKTPMSTKSHGSNAKVTPFSELEEENKNVRANDGECDDADANSSLTEKNSLEDLEIMLDKFSLGQLVDERMRLANMKMKLSTELKTFEREFIKFNGREIQKTEKLLKQDEYVQLKELKAHLRLVENLIDKKWKGEQNRNK